MKITIENERAYIYTPYNPNFVSAIKNIGGRKWESVSKCWSVPANSVETVRQIMMNIFHETDQISSEKVDVKVTFKEYQCGYHGAYILLGKSISIATGRDSGARVGEDVEILEGGVSSGGSMKNWGSVVEKGTVAILRNVTKELINELSEELKKELVIEIINNSKVDIEALKKEKENLLKRLAEIEKLLNQ